MITVFKWTYKNKKSGVYAIYNILTGKIYIGSAINLHRRLVDHLYFLNLGKHHSILLQRAWDKYESQAFEFYVLEYVNNKDILVDKEQFWMDLNDSSNPKLGYNISPTAGSCLGIKHSKEVKLARSIALKGKLKSEQRKANLSIARKGVLIHNKESRLKISEAGKNRKVSEATKLKLSKVWEGRKHSPETIEKLKAKAKLRGNNNRLGLKYTDQAKLNMSEAQRKRHSEKNNWR